MALTITATPQPHAVPPAVSVQVTDTSGGTTAVTVQRFVGGIAAGTIRTGDGGPAPLTSGTATLLDGEAPFGQPITYVANTAAISAPVVLNVTRPWLINPGHPSLSMPITIANAGTRSRDLRQGVLWPLMRARPIVRTDGQRRAPTATITVRTSTITELDALDAILDDTSVLLLNVPLSNLWGLGAEYIAVGKVDEERLVQVGASPHRHWTLPYQVTDAPLGGTGSGSSYTGGRTYADINADLTSTLGHAPTWAEVVTQYGTRAAAAGVAS